MHPAKTFEGALDGLLLWFHTVLPTLYPFMILSSLLIQTDAFTYISSVCSPLFCRLFHISPASSFAILGGFLCGYPMGANITCQLIENDKINKEEGAYLLSFCNNTSPMFIINYVLIQMLRTDQLLIPGMVIAFMSPIICSQLFYYFCYKNRFKITDSHVAISTGCSNNFFNILNQSIIKSSETIIQIGGYMMIFSVLIHLFSSDQNLLFLSSLEISNGIELISSTHYSKSIKWILSLALVSFGGFCSLAQTKSIIQNSSLPIMKYAKEKLITAFVTSLLAIIYLLIKQ
jgi:sporulation integral membrane protein YlbJ